MVLKIAGQPVLTRMISFGLAKITKYYCIFHHLDWHYFSNPWNPWIWPACSKKISASLPLSGSSAVQYTMKMFYSTTIFIILFLFPIFAMKRQFLFHLRQPMAFLSLNLYDTPGLAPRMNVLFWGPGDFPVSYSNRATSRNAWNRHSASFMIDTGILFSNIKYLSHEC